MKHVRREYVCNDLDIMVVFEEKLKDEMKDEGYVGNGESTRQSCNQKSWTCWTNQSTTIGKAKEKHLQGLRSCQQKKRRARSRFGEAEGRPAIADGCPQDGHGEVVATRKDLEEGSREESMLVHSTRDRGGGSGIG